jgi:hypothetical protein
MQKIAGTAVKTGVLALALALGGCGGGGGGKEPTAVDPPGAQRAVQGTAAKGLIKGAKVSAYAIDAQGVRATAALATAATGADGTYKMQVPAAVLSFVIEVSAAPGAMMADEASGTDLAFPESMKLRSVVTLAANAAATYEGSVSPLTEMVARTAETADGKLPQQAVAQAKIAVRTLLGFDPETVKPVNSNSPAAASASEDEKNQSLALAAMSKMASTASADCGQTTPGERIACVVTRLASSVVIKDGQPTLEQNRLGQFRDAIQAVAQDKNINRTGKDKVVGIPVLTPAPGPTTPPPVGTAPTPLEATKALFGSLRTNLRSLSEGDAFRSTADGVKADLNGVVVPLSNNISGLASLAATGIDVLDSIRAGASYSPQIEVRNNHVRNSPILSTSIANGDGYCEIVASPLGMTCTVVQNSYLPGSYAACCSAGTRVYATRSFRLVPKEGSNSEYRYTASLAKVTAQYQAGSTVGTPVTEAIGDAYSGDITYAHADRSVIQLAVHGRLPGRLNASGTLDSDYEDWSLDVGRTEEAAGTFLYHLGGQVSAIRAGEPAGTVMIEDTSFVRLAFLPTGYIAPSSANEMKLTLRGVVGSTTVSGTLRTSEGRQDKNKTNLMPTRLSFEGSLEHQDATVFTGSVVLTRNGYENFDASAAESATNFVADTLEIGGALTVPNRPTLSLTLGATSTAQDAANISAQYRDGNSVINASVTARPGERHPLVKISSADGVRFAFSSTSAPVEVTKDGAVTALLDLGKGIITYRDGSFESLQ